MAGNADQCLLSPRAGQGVGFRRTHYGAAKGIGDDQPFVFGQELLWEVLGHSEVEAVAVVFVLRPLVVDVEVGPAGFDFDHHDLTLGRNPGDVRPPPVGKRQLEHRRQAEFDQNTRCALRDRCRDLRPSVTAGGLDRKLFFVGSQNSALKLGDFHLEPVELLGNPDLAGEA